MADVNRLLFEALPAAVVAGNFGADNVKFLNFVQDNAGSGQEQFSSRVIFGDIIMETRNKAHKTQSVVIKVHANIQSHFQRSYNSQFYNELLFYNEVLPFLRKYDSEKVLDKLFPRFFYGVATLGQDPLKDILVFENVQKDGFKLSASKSFIDDAHIKLSLLNIAKFHSLSFAGKVKDPKGFKQIVSKICETRYTEEGLQEELDFGFYRKNCMRGILPLKDNPKYKNKLEDISKLVSDIIFSMQKIVAPVEPLAVLCHGDFCRNNIFYKYSSKGEPIEVKFFDLATIRYASPVIDLSFFLFMNSDPGTWSSKWDEMLETYVMAFKGNPILETDHLLTIADLRQDFQRRGFYGYVHSSYFLPMMLEEVAQSDWNDSTQEEMVQVFLNRGGERATQFVAAIVQNMIDKNFDYNYILNFKMSDVQL